MKLHSRVQIVQRASLDIRTAVLNVVEGADLTYAETVSIVTEILADYTKSALRQERHPDDPTKPSGLE